MTKYFGVDGQELFTIRAIANSDMAVKFPGVKAISADGYAKFCGYTKPDALVNDPYFPVVRMIDWKKTAEPHKCDSRCETAKGHKCECSCGGANHGKNR